MVPICSLCHWFACSWTFCTFKDLQKLCQASHFKGHWLCPVLLGFVAIFFQLVKKSNMILQVATIWKTLLIYSYIYICWLHPGWLRMLESSPKSTELIFSYYMREEDRENSDTLMWKWKHETPFFSSWNNYLMTCKLTRNLTILFRSKEMPPY